MRNYALSDAQVSLLKELLSLNRYSESDMLRIASTRNMPSILNDCQNRLTLIDATLINLQPTQKAVDKPHGFPLL